MNKEYVDEYILGSATSIRNLKKLSSLILEATGIITHSLDSGNKIILFGNGGSAADAQHIAAEFIGRYKLERKSYPALSLTTNSSNITAISNDYSFDDTFSRQCESLVSEGDVVIGISTSGESNNVKAALEISNRLGAITIGLLGGSNTSIEKIVH